MSRFLVILCVAFFLGGFVLSGCCPKTCGPKGPHHHAMSDCPKHPDCSQKMADCPKGTDGQPCPKPCCPKE